MNNNEIGQKKAKKIRGIILVIGSAAVLLAVSLAVWSQLFGSSDIVVDFSEFVLSGERDYIGAIESRPTLRVAIGAMISPKTTRQYYEELMRLIGDRMERRTVFLQRKTYAEINDMVEKKEVDVAFVCSGPYVVGHEKFGMELLVVPVSHGKKTYRSCIIVNSESPFRSLDDLKGGRFAFTDPQSNTGYLAPNFMLAQRGELPKYFFSTVFFTHSHDNSIKAVADGLADGAAVDSLIWEFMAAVNSKTTSRTRVIQQSLPFGIPPIVVHPDLSLEMKQRLKEIFLSLHEDEEAAALLRVLQIDRFGESNDGVYDNIREMRHFLEKRRTEKKW